MKYIKEGDADGKSLFSCIRAYALTGLRGCGKTVALLFVEKYFQKREDFIVISLNNDLDMFEQTLEYLSQKKLLDEF